MIGQHISHYLIKGELGRGGMGVVYLAVDTRLDREVALKFLPPHLAADPGARTRFIQEARAASALNHPAVCSVHDIGETEDGRTYIVMPFYEGHTLQERLQEGALPEGEVRRVASGVAEGLAAAHRAGIIHRDIKPANIILGPGGRVTILDFGVAKVGGGEDLTKDGSTVGTTNYMSPEQARGEPTTFRTDLWSLGVLIQEMVTGSPPFTGGYEAATTYAIANLPAEPLPDSVDADLAELVRSLLQKDPEERPASAEAVVERLSGSGSPGQALVAREPLVPSWVAKAAGGAVLLAVGLLLLTQIWAPKSADGVRLDAIAVMPFDVQAGPDLEYLDRGMVSLLSPMLDGLGGIRAVDPKAILGLVEQRDYDLIDPDEGERLAAEFGARWFLLGSLTRLGGDLQLTASLYDAAGAPVSQQSQTVSSEDSLLVAAHRILNGLLPSLVADSGGRNTSLALATTSSYPAMKAYVLAEDHYRAGRFFEARDAAERALSFDSTFAGAWYLAANASAQWALPDTRYFRRGSIRHVDGAPDRLQRLIRARDAAYESGGFETMRQLREVLARYPDDLDATAYIADQTFHLGPLVGQPASDAIPGFYRVLALSPENGEYLQHLAIMLYREGRFDALDSLHARFVPEGNLPQYRWVELLYYFAPANREAFRDSLIETGEPWFTFLLKTTLAIPEAAGLLEARQAAGRPFSAEETRLVVSMRSIMGQSIRERGSDEMARLQTAAERAAFQTYLPISQDSIRALVTSLGDISEVEFSPILVDAMVPDWSVESIRAYAYEGSGRDIAAYLRAVLSQRLGDTSAMREELEALRGVADPHRLTRHLANEIEARIQLVEGDAQGSLETLQHPLQEDPPYFPFNARLASKYYERQIERLLRAEVLFELGRYEEALRWSESVHPPFQPGAPILLPRTYQLEAEAHMALGDWQEAADRYEKLLRLWQDADPELQPQVEGARLRLQQALGRMLEEPRG